jgi:hypothetical protein
LVKYGNTREADLIDFSAKKSNCSKEDVKKAISRMVVKGKLHRIVHNQLEPPEVYVTLEEPSWVGDFEGLFEVVKEAEQDADSILREAATAAERVRERYP